YEWYLGYEERLVRKDLKWAPTLGSAVHAGIAAALLRKHMLDKLGLLFDEHEVLIAAVNDGVDGWTKRTLALVDQDYADEELVQVIRDAIDQIVPQAAEIARRDLQHIREWECRTLEDKRRQPMIEYRFEVPLRGWR